MKRIIKSQLKAMDNLTDALVDSVVEFVKQKGGFIRLRDDYELVVITQNQMFQEIGQGYVTALAVFNNQLYISHDEHITNNEDNDEWYAYDGENYVWLQTIYQIASVLTYNNY